jgi:hypothetical protein
VEAHDEIRGRAVTVLAVFVATLALGIVLLVAFEPDVQTLDADELVTRSDDARAFLIADYFFIALYAALSPWAIWRFGAAVADADPAGWMKLTAVLLAAAGVADAAENTLLLSATGAVSEGAVDAAHAVAWPKVAFFIAGAVGAIAANVRAAQTLGRPPA